MSVEYHKFVLFRSGGDTFAFHILPHPKDGEDGITYTWYRLPGGGHDSFSPKVEVGQGETKEVNGSGVVKAGPLKMEWSKGNRDSGWLYWHDAPNDVAVYSLQWMRLEDATKKSESGRWISRRSVEKSEAKQDKGGESPLDLPR